MGVVVESGAPVNRTDTGAISARSGTLLGFYVNSTTNGTIVLRDGGASGTAVTGTITPAIGFHRLPCYFTTSAHVTIANTLNVTFFFQAG